MAAVNRLLRGPLINLCPALLHQIKNPYQQLDLVFVLWVCFFQKYFYGMYSFVSKINAGHYTTQERNVSIWCTSLHSDLRTSLCTLKRGLYPAPLFHMESMWNPYGIHVVPHGICPFHMEYVLAEISPILVIFFHLYSTWNGVDSMWIPPFHMEFPHGIHVESST